VLGVPRTEFLSLLRQIENEVLAGLDVHLVLDNYATHKTAAVARWLKPRPHWHIHFIPTHSSWLNQVERFFSLITTQRIRRGTFQCSANSRPPSSNTSPSITAPPNFFFGLLPPIQFSERSLSYAENFGDTTLSTLLPLLGLLNP